MQLNNEWNIKKKYSLFEWQLEYGVGVTEFEYRVESCYYQGNQQWREAFL